jgi:pseudouridine synthase
MRLHKYMAQCGVASRRKCEEMIAGGRVTVNGAAVATMGITVAPGDIVRVDGAVIEPAERLHYILYHKPMFEMCTASDPEGRATVMDRFADSPARLFSVGRLDFDSEGLLLLTNDGELANRLMHPSFEIRKTYFSRIDGGISDDAVEKLRNGVLLDGSKTARAGVRVLRAAENQTELLITIHEGRNRQVRRMLVAVGHEVRYLRRVRFGPLSLSALERGQWRELTEDEVEGLKQLGAKKGC